MVIVCLFCVFKQKTAYEMRISDWSSAVCSSDLKPGERIRHTDRFDDPNLPGEMQVTVSLKTVACGTDIEIVQEGIPDMIPTEFCYLGWQESLSLLANVVEPDIPDGA